MACEDAIPFLLLSWLAVSLCLDGSPYRTTDHILWSSLVADVGRWFRNDRTGIVHC